MNVKKNYLRLAIFFIFFVIVMYIVITLPVELFLFCIVLSSVLAFYSGFRNGKIALLEEEIFCYTIDNKKRTIIALLYGCKFLVFLCIAGVISYIIKMYLDNGTPPDVFGVSCIILQMTYAKFSGYIEGNFNSNKFKNY